MSVQGPRGAVAAVHLGRGEEPGVYIGRMKLPSLLSTSRAAPKSSITALFSLVMKMFAGLMSEVQHLVLVHDAQATQDFIEKRADRAFTKYLVAFQIARG